MVVVHIVSFDRNSAAPVKHMRSKLCSCNRIPTFEEGMISF